MLEEQRLNSKPVNLCDCVAAIAPENNSSTAADERVETLKVLMLALLKEVEKLGKPDSHDTEIPMDLRQEVCRFEADIIRRALIRTGGRQRRAARLLGLTGPTLNRKIKRYGIDRDPLLKCISDLHLE